MCFLAVDSLWGLATIRSRSKGVCSTATGSGRPQEAPSLACLPACCPLWVPREGGSICFPGGRLGGWASCQVSPPQLWWAQPGEG